MTYPSARSAPTPGRHHADGSRPTAPVSGGTPVPPQREPVQDSWPPHQPEPSSPGAPQQNGGWLSEPRRPAGHASAGYDTAEQHPYQQPPPGWHQLEPSRQQHQHPQANPCQTDPRRAEVPRQQPAEQAWQPPPARQQAAPSPYAAPVERDEGAVTWAELRNQVVDRLRRMNGFHCVAAFDRMRGTDALAPHGIAVFYAERTTGGIHRVSLRTATRLFLAGADAADLPALLHDLTVAATVKIEKARANNLQWDPRDRNVGMVNRSEEMGPDAGYIGLGISTLDMPDMTWAEAAPAALTGLDLPGRGLALLSDGTTMLVERRPHRAFSEHGIWSSHSLDVRPGQSTRLWNRATNLVENSDAPTRHVWHRLHELHQVLLTTRRAGRAS